MIKIVLPLFFFFLLSQTIFGQITVKIEITGLKNNSGQIVLNFTDGENKPIKALYGKIKDKKCILTINDLKPRKYAFKYFHDENNNKELDTNIIGIPKEGYGFSNNAKKNFGPPDFKDTIFELKNDKTIICIARYINF